MVELPFSMKVDGRIVRGRIDAAYVTEDGGIEIVDFKTGRRFEPTSEDQLTIYARALEALGALPEEGTLTLTYAFLGDEGSHSRTLDAQALSRPE